jgi:ankyrin repeat protein
MHTKAIPQSLEKGVTSKHRKITQYENPDLNDNDPLLCQKATKINFINFLMFFYGITQLDKLIMKPIFSAKQRKLSHLICIFGHQYLLKEVLKQIDMYHHCCLNKHIMTEDNEHSLSGDADFTNSKAIRILQTQY